MLLAAQNIVGNPMMLSTGENGDVSLAHTMHIPLTHGGKLISFSEVKEWINPDNEQLNQLRDRIQKEWMDPLQLRQQDIVKATGVGAPYVCYLFKDPENPNMTQRRRVEAYSVLSELFRKWDANEIREQDFLSLKNNRIQNRYHKRQTSGATGEEETETEDNTPSIPKRRRLEDETEASDSEKGVSETPPGPRSPELTPASE